MILKKKMYRQNFSNFFFREKRLIFDFGENFELKNETDFLEKSEMAENAEQETKLDVNKKLSFLKKSISENTKEKMLQAQTLWEMFHKIGENNSYPERKKNFTNNKDKILAFVQDPNKTNNPFSTNEIEEVNTPYSGKKLQNIALKRWIKYQLQESEKSYDMQISAEESERMREGRQSREEEYTQKNILPEGDEREVKIQNILNYAIDKKGNLEYVWGGTNLSTGADCSGFTQSLFKQYGKKNIPRTALEQSKGGVYIEKGNLKEGDLVFFKTNNKRTIPITHVGIYTGDGNFIHAQSKKTGVVITSLDDSLYKNKFVTARRYL